MLLAGVVLLGALSCIPRLNVDVRSDAFLSETDPAILARDRVKARFGLSEPLVIALDAGATGAVYRADNLALLAALSERVATIPNVVAERVFSLATESNIAAREDGLDIARFLDPVPEDPTAAAQLQASVEGFPLYIGSLVSDDGQVALILVELEDERQAEQSYHAVRELLADTTVPAGTRLHLAGEGAISGYMGSYVDADARRLIPVAWLIITAVVFLAFRRLAPALFADAIMLLTVVSTVGLMAACGVSFYVITNALPVILIGIAVADTLHILSHYDDLRARDPSAANGDLVRLAMADMWRPVAITSLTTMAGFLGLAWASFMPPFRYFGIFSAVGVGLAWLYSMTVLPALMTLFPPRQPAHRPVAPAPGSGLRSALARLGGNTLDHSGAVVLACALLVAGGLYAALEVGVDDDPISVFHADEPVAVADRLINARMNGTNTLDVVVAANEAEGLFSPERLRRIEELQRFAETLPYVGGTISIVDYLKQMNRALHDDDPDWYRLPESSEAVAQFFLLYAAMSDPTDFEEEVDYDYRSANVRIFARSGGYQDTRELVEEVERYVESHFHDGDLSAEVSGRLLINHRWIKSLADGHFGGLLLSLVMVWAVAALLFRSLVAGLMTLVPVLASVLLVYGVMALSGLTLGMGTSMFAAIAVGLGIDFAIHSIDRLRVLRQAFPAAPRDAFLALYPGTGRALLFNALAVGGGFGILMISKIVSLTTFGLIVMLAISTSFVASMTLLPAVLWRVQPAFLREPARSGGFPWRWVVVAVVCVLTVFAIPRAQSGTAALSAEEVVTRINAVGEGRPLTRTLQMTLTDSRGKQRIRETISYRQQVGDALRTAVFYTAPANVRDTAFLTWDYNEAGREDEQWLYLPALRKSRRIPAADRGDYFLGTDLTYEDIKLDGKLSLEDYAFELTGSGEVDGFPFYTLQAQPRSEETAAELGYSRLGITVDASTWLATEVVFFGPGGDPLKTLTVDGIAEVDGVWTRSALEVVNQQTGHRTRFEFSDIDYSTEIDASLFTRQALERGR